jgi:multiple sugar transport system ATP-binding protein
MAAVSFDGVSKRFGDGTEAVSGMTLDVADGEFMALVGPSGCGKTTALRMVAGLEQISYGCIRIGDRVVNQLAPEDRDVAMVFQTYALYPHKSVYENIAFALKIRRTPKHEIDRRVRATSHTLGLSELLERKPGQLSGGQRQRVAMGRAIVRDPAVFLMDEPLSNLDARLRLHLRAEVSRIQHELGATTIYVTHDQIEAMTMADRVAVVRGGRLQQLDRPQRLYRAPANLFVASFIGSPPMNLLAVTVERDRLGLRVRVGDQRIPLPADVTSARPRLEQYVDRELALGIRPETARLGTAEPADGIAALSGEVQIAEDMGAEQLVHLSIRGAAVTHEQVIEVIGEADPALRPLDDGARGEWTTLLCRLPREDSIRPGSQLSVAFDIRDFHFFDLSSGEAIVA